MQRKVESSSEGDESSKNKRDRGSRASVKRDPPVE